jgi:hypothetical protein
VTLVGEIADTTGTGLFTAKLREDEVPPPGAGVVTAIVKTAADAVSAAVS